jgi:hypothetical protein
LRTVSPADGLQMLIHAGPLAEGFQVRVVSLSIIFLRRLGSQAFRVLVPDPRRSPESTKFQLKLSLLSVVAALSDS